MGAAGVFPAAPLVPRFRFFTTRSASLVFCGRLTRGRRHGWRQSGLARPRKPRPLRRGVCGVLGVGVLGHGAVREGFKRRSAGDRDARPPAAREEHAKY